MSALHDRLTLAQLDIHTGIGVSSDLLRAALRLRRVCKKLNCHLPGLPRALQSEPALLFTPVFRTPRGLMEQSPTTNPEYVQRHPGASAVAEKLSITPGVPLQQDPARCWRRASQRCAR